MALCDNWDRMRSKWWTLVAIAIAIAIAAVVLLVVFDCFGLRSWVWDWSRSGGEAENNGKTLRNLALSVAAVLFGPVGIGLAIWRNRTATKQAETAEKGLNNERYQRGAEMLGNPQLATRLGGISSLSYLAEQQPEEYHIMIMNLVAAFVRHPEELDENAAAGLDDESKPHQVRFDVEEAVRTVIGGRTEKQLKMEKKINYCIDLCQADLHRAELRGMCLNRVDLKGAMLDQADLTDAYLINADFSIYSERWKRENDESRTSPKSTSSLRSGATLDGTILTGANLTDANFSNAQFSNNADLTDARVCGADFRNAILGDADITNADFRGAKNLTQRQLEEVLVNPDGNPPRLPEGQPWADNWGVEPANDRWRERYGGKG